jgi:hypothetical protein
MSHFQPEEILPRSLYAQVTEMRLSDPEYSFRAAQNRPREGKPQPRSKLNIIAADHPARGVLAVGGDPIRMANRHDYLARVLRVLSSELIDGVMGSMDILEDLFTIDGLLQEQNEPSILDGKVLIASLNRGGIAGSSWEMDDPMTGPSPQTCFEWKLDGAKILLRICLNDERSLKTLVASAHAITEANALSLPTYLEPLPVVKSETGFRVQKSKEALALAVSVASALGDSSRYLWLKLPYCDDYETVASATSLPILILGGESVGDPSQFLKQIAAAMSAGVNVRGALVGRNVLYPGDADPLMVADAVGGIVHKGLTVDQVVGAASV